MWVESAYNRSTYLINDVSSTCMVASQMNIITVQECHAVCTRIACQLGKLTNLGPHKEVCGL